jgi:hypothetical protein
MSNSNNLTIKVKSNSKMLLLLLSFASAFIAMITANTFGAEGEFATIIFIATVASMFCLILWVNAIFERLTIKGNEIRYRYFLFVSRKADRATLDNVTICERSGALRFIVRGKRFASLNFSVIDITQEEFEKFAERRNIPIEYVE